MNDLFPPRREYWKVFANCFLKMLSRAWDAAQFTVFSRFAQSPGFSAQKRINQMWWQTSVVPVLRRSRHKDQKFKAILGYISNSGQPGILDSCLKSTKLTRISE